jgi:hypothetical protein
MNVLSIFAPVRPESDEQEIREFAFWLYQQGRCEPGHDLANWHDAIAWLKAKISRVPLAQEESELLADL